jgi:hypothetical protein
MITGLPPFVPPQLLQVRCPCGSLYFVHCGEGDEGTAGAMEMAAARGARFVESRLEPFVLCGCGQDLDFTAEGSLAVQ